MEPLNYGDNEVNLDEVNKFHFGYIKPNEKTTERLEFCRNDYYYQLHKLHTIPPSRERALAITKLEESLMFATKAIVVASKG